MLSNFLHKLPHLGGKIASAWLIVGVIKPQGVPHNGQAVARYGPIRNVVVFLCGSHIVDVLRIIRTGNVFRQAGELPWLKNRTPRR